MKTIPFKIISVVCIIILIFYLCIKKRGVDKENKQTNITINTFEVENGFGYEIIENNNIIIKQEYIPVIKGKRFFCTEKEAKTIAEIIKYKIEHKESPMITYKELLESKIFLNCW